MAQKMDILLSDWMPIGSVIDGLPSAGESSGLHGALLDHLTGGTVRAICTSSRHTYRTTTYSDTGVSAIPPEEWQHYQASESALESGMVRMQWTSQVSLPILGLCQIVAQYSGVHLCLEDLAREFPELALFRARAKGAAQPSTSADAPAVSNRPDALIDLAAAGRSVKPAVRRRSAPCK